MPDILIDAKTEYDKERVRRANDVCITGIYEEVEGKRYHTFDEFASIKAGMKYRAACQALPSRKNGGSREEK